MKIKKAQLKSLFLIVLFGVMLVASVFAFDVTLNSPISKWVLSNSVDFNFTVNSTGQNLTVIPWCAIYTNKTGSVALEANYSLIANGTSIKSIGFADSTAIDSYRWNVTCSNGSTLYSADQNVTFGVDGNIPSVSLDSPAFGSYLTSTTPPFVTLTFGYTPTDSSNLDSCVLYHNISGSFIANITNSSVETGITDFMNITNVTDGTYGWNVLCNDSASNSAFAIQNFTLTVDSLVPSGIAWGSPLNNSNSNDSTPTVRWNLTTETNFEKYQVRVYPFVNRTEPIQSIDVTNISQNFTTLSNIENDGTYYLEVEAFDLAGNSVNSTSLLYYNLYTVTLNMTLNSPLNNTYTADNNVVFNVTVIDANPSQCLLYLSTTTGTVATLNVTNTTVFNNTPVFLAPEPNSSKSMLDGNYSFNIGCNSTETGVLINISSESLKVTIDTINPTQPNITSTFGDTNNTDKTPVLIWQTATEINFERYLASAHYYFNATLAFSINVTNQSINYTALVLTANNTYNFSVITYDLAGNTAISSDTSEQYYVDPVCGTLATGWNLCGAVWNTSRNLSDIGRETSATFVSIWNNTHQWATCNFAVSPGGVHCNQNVGINNDDVHAVWVYVNETTLWRNRTWVATQAHANISLINTSNGVSWNLEGGFFRNGRIFGDLGRDLFEVNNVTMFSMIYNNATTVPYVNKGLFVTINNVTNWDYGRGMWIYYNDTGTTTLDVGAW